MPLLWKHPHDIAEKTAKSRWEKAEKFYDTLLATYHNKNFINLELPFIRLLLQRRFINHICDIKQRKFSIKGSSFIKKIWISYKIKRLEAWVKNFLWAFKHNSDLGDVQLMHFAIYGFSDSTGDDHSRKPGVCITCDPIEVVEKRLFLCSASHNELAQQVHGWNLSLCPGKIICLKFTNQKFVHVKTIDVQQFFDSFESRKRSRFNLKYKVSMFFSAITDIIKNKKNNLLSKIFR